MIGTKTAVLFAVNGLTKAAAETIRFLYQNKHLHILVLGRKDLENIANGENFISILENRHRALTLGY